MVDVLNAMNLDADLPSPNAEDLLLVRHREGDTGAFAEILQRFKRPVFSYFVRSGVAEADRDDLFQEVFLRLHRSAHRFEAGRRLGPWILTIAANLVRNHYRKSGNDRLVLVEELPEGTSEHASPERQAVAGQRFEQIEAAITELPSARRQVLLLVAIEGLSTREAAEALELPHGTVKTHLRRARLALAKRLASSSGEAS